MPADAAFLRDIPLFHHMDDEERAAIAALMEEQRFAAGQPIFKEGEPGSVCYTVRSGRVELSVQEKGKSIVVDVMEPGELFGELSVVDGGNRSASALALTDVETLVLKREHLLDLLRRKPDTAQDVLIALAKRIRRADAQIKRVAENPNEVIEARETLGDRVADGVASFGGSWAFVLSFLGLLFTWVVWNRTDAHKPDPFPFILLNLILSMIAALQAPVIMMSQNRQDAKDRIRSEADYEVNVKAHVAILELHEKVDRLERELDELRKL
ncbi:MAG: DUF1003 domain-containing protein [Acidobacteriota bacterium]